MSDSQLRSNTHRRYVVLEHEVGPQDVHYDLCLEDGAVLVTFQLDSPPAASTKVSGRRSFDHRPLYLEFEGALSRGRGSVLAWDRGVAEDLAGDLRGERYSFRCRGERLSGEWTLEGRTGEGARVELEPRRASA